MWAIAKKDILENLKTHRFFVLTGLLAILMAVSLVVSYGDYQIRMENHAILRPGVNSADVMIEPNPLSIFVRGLDPNLGRLYEISLLGIDVHSNQQAINRLFSLFVLPDMLFIISVILSLTAVLFSFDAISGEKEIGTLKLLFVNGCSRASVLLGKLTGRWALVFLPYSFLFLFSAIVLSLLPDVQANGYYWERTAFIGLVGGLYTLAFTAVGIFVSTLFSASRASMMAGLGLWVLFVFVIPPMGTILASSVAQVPGADRVEMQSRLSAIQAIYERIQKEKDSGDPRAGIEMIQQIKDANSHILESYRPELNHLVRVTKTILRCSPAGSLTFLLTDASNTGILAEFRFKDAIAAHMNRNFDRIVGIEDAQVGAFIYDRSSLAETLAESGFVDLLILCLFGLGFSALAMREFARYDPR